MTRRTKSLAKHLWRDRTSRLCGSGDRNIRPSTSPSSVIREYAYAPAPKLPFPVVLPLRRPKNSSCNSIRAYAPVLSACGIDQALFLDFLETFDRASQASPWLSAVNLASIGTMFVRIRSPVGFARDSSFGSGWPSRCKIDPGRTHLRKSLGIP